MKREGAPGWGAFWVMKRNDRRSLGSGLDPFS